jgi:hypothetical protein
MKRQTGGLAHPIGVIERNRGATTTNTLVWYLCFFLFAPEQIEEHDIHVYDFAWTIVRHLIVDLASAFPAIGSFSLFKRARQEPKLSSRGLLGFGGALLLGAVAVWLFFALHSWGWR